MLPLALLALTSVGHATQSTTWPNFVLRANVTTPFQGIGNEESWHNFPLGTTQTIDVPLGPLFDDSPCDYSSRMGIAYPYDYLLTWFFYSIAHDPAARCSTSELVSDLNQPRYIHIASAEQRDEQGRRAVSGDWCGPGSSSLHISETEPYHLVYDNQDVEESFGGFYVCAGGGWSQWGDAVFYRTDDEEMPEGCGEVVFYPECVPLHYQETTTQGIFNVTISHEAPGAYNARCYINVAQLTGPPNLDPSHWMSMPRTGFSEFGKISLNGTAGVAAPTGY